MKKLLKKAALLPLIALLASCASPQQKPQIVKLHNQVGKLNTQVEQLTEQATALTRQNGLNSSSTQGAWLLPVANTAVPLQSQLGEVRLSLSHVESEANGTRAILHIRSAADNSLPAFTATVEWGELDPTTGKPLQVSSQSQSFSVAASLLPRSEVTVPLRLSNLPPEQLGYMRVHDLVAQSAPAP